MKTQQIDFWNGDFGKNYTDRNPQNMEEWDQLYLTQYGITKTEINKDFFENLNKDIKILEVGCNIGLQLAGLQKMGFTNLYGIELQSYAVQRSKEMFKNINIIQGSGFDIPYKNDFFDVVMTNGVLIHIKPENLSVIMNEMIRCTKQYIIGFEYYAEELQDIPYRGNIGYLWKGNYAQEFVKINSSLKIIGKKIYPYINQAESGNQDIHYLLEK